MYHGFKIILLSAFLTLSYLSPSAAQTPSYPDVKIISSDDQALVIEYKPVRFKLIKSRQAGQIFMLPDFYEARCNARQGQPQLPFRVLKIAVPQFAKPTLQVLAKETDTYSAVNILPAPNPAPERRGLKNAAYRADKITYASNKALPQEIAVLQPTSPFRDIGMVEVKLTPMQYNPAGAQLTVYKKIRLKINYNAQTVYKKSFVRRGKLDALYQDMFVNFDQAKNWQQSAPRALSKTAYLPEGTWYKIPVKEDGLYKISAGVLSAAGIDLKDLAVDRIQMFNNGGHMLSYKTTESHYNPPFLTEIAVFVKDVDQNGIFNGNDYILFYGKNVNGWFYDYTLKDFVFQKHLYAKENVYWLTVSGSGGKRMFIDPLRSQPQAGNADFHYERYHFEEDLYNLLASGPDWYGRRFFGRSDSYSKSFTISTDNIPQAQAAFRVRLKGGTGVKWVDKDYYNYELCRHNNTSLNHFHQ